MIKLLPGISSRAAKVILQTYFPYDEKENAEQYEKICNQRALERKVRASKRECTALDTLGDKEGFDKAAYKLKQQEQQLKSYCEKNGLTYKPDRTATPGYGRSQAAKTTASYNAAIKAEQEKIKQLEIDKSAESGTRFLKGNNYSVKFNKVSGTKEITKELAREFSDEYDKASKLFGLEKQDNIKAVEVVPYKNDGIYGLYTLNSGVITMFGVGGKDGKAFMTKVAKDMKKKGEWSTDSPLHAYRHELGHAIQEHLSANYKDYGKKLKIITELRQSVFDDLTKISESDTIKEKARLLSTYGINEFDEIDEFISEGIAEWLNGKPRQTAKKIVDILLGRS